jgi:uncharacterized protein
MRQDVWTTKKIYEISQGTFPIADDGQAQSVMTVSDTPPLRIAVIGSGISGMSAAWLLSERHHVTVYEKDERLGGHTNTVNVPGPGGEIAVDTGFIVYNEPAYPNLTALFRHLGVATKASDMSFAVSLDGGRFEYSGTDLNGLFAQRRNLVSPRFWSMLMDLRRFYRDATGDLPSLGMISLGAYLDRHKFGAAFRDDHLLPMAAAIWSAPSRTLLDYPAASFIRFCDNHGLLKISGRPIWRTVEGGAKTYIASLTARSADRIRVGCGATAVARLAAGVRVRDARGGVEDFDHVVFACHGDQALALLDDPDEHETAGLQAFRYSRNRALLHRDPGLMPQRKRVWASWNYLGARAASAETRELCVTYWMNRLQGIQEDQPLFVTLNPIAEPRGGTLIAEEIYEHPIFDADALAAQQAIWGRQGTRNTWFCGAHFGSGFHEDGLQSGLAVAERLGGLRRPWNVAGESDRIPRFAAASAHPQPAMAP